MKTRRYLNSTVLLGLLMLFSISLTAVHAANIISLRGYVQTEGVDISISAEADQSEIMPGKCVYYKPVISYKGVDAYIRMRLNISNNKIGLDSFNGLSDEWIRKGEYFYYKKPVSHNEKIATFTSFKIPEDWNEIGYADFMGSVFQITALCDAVQAENFEPDFESDLPWGELGIEDNEYDGNRFSKKENAESVPAIIGFKGAGSYSLSSRTLLKKQVLPGDTFKNEVHLHNKGRNDVEVMFFVSEQERDELIKLLDAVSLTIRIDGNVFYEGNLRATELTKQRSLVSMKPGTMHKLSYEIHVPAKLKNVYEEKADDFIWNFTAIEYPENPKTGDICDFLSFTILFGISMILLILTRKIRKGERDE